MIQQSAFVTNACNTDPKVKIEMTTDNYTHFPKIINEEHTHHDKESYKNKNNVRQIASRMSL